MAYVRPHVEPRPTSDERDYPILLCLLGSFRVLKAGRPVALRSGGKTESLLYDLALRPAYGAPRERLLCSLWPNSDNGLASQSLNSLVYSLHRLLGDELGGRAPVLFADGCYRLNAEAGVAVDVACFDGLVRAADRELRAGDRAAAAELYAQAERLYRGDLCAGVNVHAVVERERLRAIRLTVLARLADFSFDQGDYRACLDWAQRILASDPCREDGHRVAMRCYVRLGERAQALRQYRLCEQFLRIEFDARPEPATTSLFDLIRSDPADV